MTGVDPLHGRVVAVTRPRQQAPSLIDGIVKRGGTALVYPLIDIRFSDDPGPWQRAFAGVPDALVFTSVNGVRAFAHATRIGMSVPASPWIAVCVGETTAAAARAAGMAVAALPRVYAADRLGEAVAAAGLCEGRLLWVRGNLADLKAATALRETGCKVMDVIGYETVETAHGDRLVSDVCAGQLDVITFLSGSAAHAFARALDRAGLQTADLPSALLLASIGPKTTQEMQDCGLVATVTARAATAEQLINDVAAHVAAREG